MSIKRVSDCEAIFLDNELQEYIDATYRNPMSTKGIVLPKSKMEISWNENSDSSKFTSKAIDVVALCAVYTDAIYNKDIHMHGNKTLDYGDLTVDDGNVYINNKKSSNPSSAKNIKAVANELSVVTQAINIDNKGNCNFSNGGECVNTINGDNTNTIKGNYYLNSNSGINIQCTGSGKKITMTAPKIVFNYTDTMEIQYNGTTFLTYGHTSDGTTPTVKFSDKISQANPITGYINHALWS